MSRNFGIMNGSASQGGLSTDGPATRADTLREHEFQLPSEADKDFAALCFALFGLTCPFAFAGLAIVTWLMFFD